ncbi:GRAMD1A isoform 7 [Pongo abelii]|uniref:GRAMD1A isoform 7 n=1 Tax=Pongo abelii TaxID=9601 RepID=A0A2J8RR55_PONAB|nr:GRAMD1A isoform 7 [Pongo abelii]
MFDTTPHSGRSTPSSSPSLRKRLQLLPPSRPPPEPEPGTMVEKGSDSSSEKGGVPGTPSTQSLGSRNFIRNSKKMQSWYSMLSPTYKQRNEDFRKLFSKLPEAERLIVDYSCALQREILLQGRLYLSENWICFYSNIFRWETTISIQLKEVTCLKKEKTAKLIPNAIQICTESEKVTEDPVTGPRGPPSQQAASPNHAKPRLFCTLSSLRAVPFFLFSRPRHPSPLT